MTRDVVVLDVGEKHQHELSNFDHHQFNRNDDPACSFNIVTKKTWTFMNKQALDFVG